VSKTGLSDNHETSLRATVSARAASLIVAVRAAAHGEHSLRAKVRACVLQQPHYFVSCDTRTSSDSGKWNPAGTPARTTNADNNNKTNNFIILDAHCIDEVDDMDTAGAKK
jgi:hypothetical protein